jgi:hypothetical protein
LSSLAESKHKNARKRHEHGRQNHYTSEEDECPRFFPSLQIMGPYIEETDDWQRKAQEART